MRYYGANAGGCRAYWTKIAVHCFLVNDVAAMPIFLTIHDERHRGGGCEENCIAGGQKQSLALPKPDVADSKLHSTSGAMFRRERILANA
jgi:hypothetical protein